VPGPVALIGAGAVLSSIVDLDRELLAATGRRRPRVVILATTPRGTTDDMARSIDVGVDHFKALGAEVEPILIPPQADDADDAALQALAEADLVYLADLQAGRLCAVLERTHLGSALRDVHDRGAVLVGCSRAAGVLASRQPVRRAGLLPWPILWRPALGVLEGAAIVTGYDRWPEPFAALLALQAPRGTTLLGIDAATALVGREGAWQVHGPARVTVWRGRHRRRYRRGDVFRL
jgi:cyanophycinase-like exopeptidase